MKGCFSSLCSAHVSISTSLEEQSNSFKMFLSSDMQGSCSLVSCGSVDLNSKLDKQMNNLQMALACCNVQRCCAINGHPLVFASTSRDQRINHFQMCILNCDVQGSCSCVSCDTCGFAPSGHAARILRAPASS